MSKIKASHRGVALFAVIVVILVVALLANVIIILMLNQTTLTRHQLNRIKAYYAVQTGANLALSKLRQGLWAYNDNYAINCTSAACIGSVTDDAVHRYSDPGIPYEVIIRVNPQGVGGPNNTTMFSVTTNYASPP
jgi:Tfp pilus assembly protein PilX